MAITNSSNRFSYAHSILLDGSPQGTFGHCVIARSENTKDDQRPPSPLPPSSFRLTLPRGIVLITPLKLCSNGTIPLTIFEQNIPIINDNHQDLEPKKTNTISTLPHMMSLELLCVWNSLTTLFLDKIPLINDLLNQYDAAVQTEKNTLKHITAAWNKDASKVSAENKQTAFESAAKFNHLNDLQYFMEHPDDQKICMPVLWSSMHTALRCQAYKAAHYLIQQALRFKNHPFADIRAALEILIQHNDVVAFQHFFDKLQLTSTLERPSKRNELIERLLEKAKHNKHIQNIITQSHLATLITDFESMHITLV